MWLLQCLHRCYAPGTLGNVLCRFNFQGFSVPLMFHDFDVRLGGLHLPVSLRRQQVNYNKEQWGVSGAPRNHSRCQRWSAYQLHRCLLKVRPQFNTANCVCASAAHQLQPPASVPCMFRALGNITTSSCLPKTQCKLLCCYSIQVVSATGATGRPGRRSTWDS